ncbi:hypothetical protein DV738_g4716, partial [Chaetothyriales sp. CBS 135597]
MAKFITSPFLACAVILTVALFLLSQNYSALHWPQREFSLPLSSSLSFNSEPTAKVAKVSAIYGEVNEYYDAAVESHRRHASRHGYPFHVLRHPVADGYWNKAQYLHALLVMELAKPIGERMKWLMWVDADSAIINPVLGVEIFLPPDGFDDIHFLGSKDQNGLNTGIFFIRVHQWSVNLLTKTLGMPLLTDIDLGFSADQTAMAMILNETENQGHVLYQPRAWYNTYQFEHGYEGKPGCLLVHFPGLDERWDSMGEWLQVLNNASSAAKWEVPFPSTHYPDEIDAYWKSIQRGRRLISDANGKMADQINKGQITEDDLYDLPLFLAVRALDFTLLFEADQPKLVEQATQHLVDLLEG